ncbi:hypothetical protein SRHO_G00100180 [Serrasalmus rhombeus]
MIKVVCLDFEFLARVPISNTYMHFVTLLEQLTAAQTGKPHPKLQQKLQRLQQQHKLQQLLKICLEDQLKVVLKPSMDKMKI